MQARHVMGHTLVEKFITLSLAKGMEKPSQPLRPDGGRTLRLGGCSAVGPLLLSFSCRPTYNATWAREVMVTLLSSH